MGILQNIAARLFGVHPEKTEAQWRSEALTAVVDLNQSYFSAATDGPSDEECTKVELYQHVVSSPGEYFLCSHCSDGPWHRFWTGSSRRNRALGPCCSGAD